jgi:DNA modification methylase
MADVTITERHIADYSPDPANARKHTPRNVGVIEDSLQAVGVGRSLVADERDIILAGNATIDAAASAGLTKVIEIETDGDALIVHKRRNLNPTQKIQLALADNRSAELATWDEEQLRTLQAEAPDLLKPLFTDTELGFLLSATAKKDGLTDPDDVPAERHTDIQRGNLFELGLGRHRLLCGDSRETDAVEAVMGGALADGMWTDPPFGVNYVGKTSEALVVHGDRESDLAPLLREAFAAADRVLTPGAAIYVAHPAGRNAVVFGQAFLAIGWHFHQGLVWVKDSMVLGHSDFHYQHESIIYGWKKGANRTWLSDRTQVTIFAIDRPTASRDHPTSKPVELVLRQIGNNVPAGGVIFEPFCGSGTTLIAAEQLGISCRAIELSPAYCQVIVDRWEAFTGQKAVKL